MEQIWLQNCSYAGRMPLSESVRLVFVLRRSGFMGSLTAGRIERDGSGGINVYSGWGDGVINDYISGSNLRSWCALGLDGKPLPGWEEIDARDRAQILSWVRV